MPRPRSCLAPFAAAFAATIFAASCSPPPPPPPAPPPPPPPSPTAPPTPVPTQEPLSIHGRSQPAGPGKQAVLIFVNGQQVISGTMTKGSPRATFRGKYHEHDIEAKCRLVDRVDCEILVDGSPESGAVNPPARERP